MSLLKQVLLVRSTHACQIHMTAFRNQNAVLWSEVRPWGFTAKDGWDFDSRICETVEMQNWRVSRVEVTMFLISSFSNLIMQVMISCMHWVMKSGLMLPCSYRQGRLSVLECGLFEFIAKTLTETAKVVTALTFRIEIETPFWRRKIVKISLLSTVWQKWFFNASRNY